MTSVRLAPMLTLLVLACGCEASHSLDSEPTATFPNPVAPTGPTGPTLPRGNFTISGTVTERLAGGGVRVIPNADVNAWVQLTGMGYSYWYANGPHHADNAGRYQLQNLPASAIVNIDAGAEGYVQQCASPPIRIEADTTVDVQLVSRAILSASPNTVPATPGFRFVSGVVFENTEAGRRPVPDAFVAYEPVRDFVAAWTYSDAAGRYLLCGVPIDQRATIEVGLGRRYSQLIAQPGETTGLDIALP